MQSLDRSQAKIAAELAAAEKAQERLLDDLAVARARVSRLRKQKALLDRRVGDQSAQLELELDQEEADLRAAGLWDEAESLEATAPDVVRTFADNGDPQNLLPGGPNGQNPGLMSPGFLREIGLAGTPPTSQGS